ncbi:hypothetical protein TNCT_68311 [Trichonephila clavata]|uniref:Uncharacterized protein n=1 Tax=Trichonephila clavata TaxID=2740835 RepID=A0A8X6KQE1_TRICU|nr:hypothetical protein TNCT_68311 [Trichonephila clavata]
MYMNDLQESGEPAYPLQYLGEIAAIMFALTPSKHPTNSINYQSYKKTFKRTGRDPLSTFSSNKNTTIVEENDSDCYFNRVHPFSKSNGDFTSLI